MPAVRKELILILLALCSATTGCFSPTVRRQQASASAGRELLLRIDAHFLRDDGLYSTEIGVAGPSPAAAACWPAAVQLSASVVGARVDSTLRVPLASRIDRMDAYWNPAGPVPGYDASPNPQKPDRYYDDNAWMALALLDAFELTRDAEQLRRARAALKFVLSGEDETLAGGIWWHEQTRASKNACSTGPAIVACLRMYRITGDKSYRAAGERLLRWINVNLRDVDGLYIDHITVEGKREPTKFSYNTGAMILAHCAMFDLTRDARYLDEARRSAVAGLRFWVSPATGAIRDDVAFGALFAESLLELYRRDGDRRWRDAALSAVEFLRVRNTTRDGWHPTKWDAPAPTKLDPVRLIDQSAAARAMLLIDAVR